MRIRSRSSGSSSGRAVIKTAGRPPPRSCVACGFRASWTVCLVTAMVPGDDLLACSCPCCGSVFAICRPCYRGHRFCGRRCARLARVATLRKARQRYRRSPAGREAHRLAERERRQLRRFDSVGDQGSAVAATSGTVRDPEPARVVAVLAEPEAARVTLAPSRPRLHCILCWRPARLLRTSAWPRRDSCSPRRWQIAPRTPS